MTTPISSPRRCTWEAASRSSFAIIQCTASGYPSFIHVIHRQVYTRFFPAVADGLLPVVPPRDSTTCVQTTIIIGKEGLSRSIKRQEAKGGYQWVKTAPPSETVEEPLGEGWGRRGLLLGFRVSGGLACSTGCRSIAPRKTLHQASRGTRSEARTNSLGGLFPVARSARAATSWSP